MKLAPVRQPLGQLLLGRGAVAPAQLETALADQRRAAGRKLLGEILVESRLCSEEQIAEALADSYGVPFARVSPRLADAKLLPLLPRDFLEREQVLPLFLVEGVLTVAVVESSNLFLLDEIRRITGHKVQPVAATAADIEATLRSLAPKRTALATGDVAPDAADDLALRTTAAVARADGAAPPVAADRGAADVERLVRDCLCGAIEEAASDVHFEPGEPGARVRYRIDGRLVDRVRLPRQTHVAAVAHLRALTAGGAPRSAPVAGSAWGGVVRVRTERRVLELPVNASPVKYGDRVVVRIGDGARPLPRLEKLGFGYETLKLWRRLIAAPRGLLLVTGPAGSGKHATLCSTLAELDTAGLNVCAVDDSADRVPAGVNQFRADGAAGLDRADALRAALGQDCDVVALPDTAEPDVARCAAGAAMSGKLVLCGVGAADAVGAILRLLALGVEPYVLGASLGGVLSQRLVRRLCPQCREGYDPTSTERKQIERFTAAVSTLYRPKGCNLCRNTGYAGRIGFFELFVPTETFCDALCRGATRAELLTLAQPPGTRSLKADGAEKVKTGITTLSEFLIACSPS